MFRFALLLCDNLLPSPKFEDRFGNFSHIFTEFLAQSVAFAPIEFNLDSYDVVDRQEYPTPSEEDRYDAIIIAGASISILGHLVWIQKLLRYVRRMVAEKPRVRLFGICFGHEIISLALGGVCVSMGGRWELGPNRIDLTGLGKQLLGAEELILNHYHCNEVLFAPPSFYILGSTSACYNQGSVRFYPNEHGQVLKNVHVLTLQGHPEFHADIIRYAISAHEERNEIDKFTVGIAKARLRVGWRDDGVGIIGRAIWGILGVYIYRPSPIVSTTPCLF